MAQIENRKFNSDEFSDKEIHQALELFYSKPNTKVITAFHSQKWKSKHFNYLKYDAFTGTLNVNGSYDKVYAELLECAINEGLKYLQDKASIEEIIDSKLYGLERKMTDTDSIEYNAITETLQNSDDEETDTVDNEEKKCFLNSFNGTTDEFSFLELLIKNAAINKANKKDYTIYQQSKNETGISKSNYEDDNDDECLEGNEFGSVSESSDFRGKKEIDPEKYIRSITDFLKGKSNDELIKILIDNFGQIQFDVIKANISIKYSNTKSEYEMEKLLIIRIKKYLKENLKLQSQILKVSHTHNIYMGNKFIEKEADKSIHKSNENFYHSLEEKINNSKNPSIVSRFLLVTEILYLTESKKTIKEILPVEALVVFNTRHRFNLIISS